MQSPVKTMSLRDFESRFCADILERSRFIQTVNHVVGGIFDFDGTEDGDPVIYAKDGTVIPIHDITTMSKEDFKNVYQNTSPLEAFVNYRDNYTIRTGADAVFEHNQSLQDAAVRSKLAARLLECNFAAM